MAIRGNQWPSAACHGFAWAPACLLMRSSAPAAATLSPRTPSSFSSSARLALNSAAPNWSRNRSSEPNRLTPRHQAPHAHGLGIVAGQRPWLSASAARSSCSRGCAMHSSSGRALTRRSRGSVPGARSSRCHQEFMRSASRGHQECIKRSPRGHQEVIKRSSAALSVPRASRRRRAGHAAAAAPIPTPSRAAST